MRTVGGLAAATGASLRAAVLRVTTAWSLVQKDEGAPEGAPSVHLSSVSELAVHDGGVLTASAAARTVAGSEATPTRPEDE